MSDSTTVDFLNWVALFFGIVIGIVLLLAAAQFVYPAPWVSVDAPQWHVETNGTMVLDAFTLSNTTEYELKDFVVGCDARGNSGTIIATPRATLYEVLAKGQEMKFASVVLEGIYPDQATTTSCRVIDAHHVW
jgi:hypothetical protein